MNEGTFDVAVIGAGVTGASIARELSRYKADVALLDKEADVSFGSSKANSGIIHAGFHSKPGTLQAELCVLGNRAFDTLSEELNFPFERRGALVVAFSEEELISVNALYEQGRKNHVPYLELLGAERVREMEPHLNRDIAGALYAPTAGIIGPYEFCFASAENAIANGVRLFVNSELVSAKRDDSGLFRLVCASGLELSCRFLVNAAGLGADEVAELAGDPSIRIHPRKGEEYLLDRRVASLVRRIVFPVPTPHSKGMLIIPTVDGPVMIGPTADDALNKEDRDTTRDGLEKVFENAQRLLPGIGLRDILASFAGLRPVMESEDFLVAASSGVPGLVHAAGIQSPGLTASPAIAQRIVRILLKEGLRLEEKPDFDPVRPAFPRLKALLESGRSDAVEDFLREHPTGSRLVCRCEKVTEAEIVAAIRRGHTTLDSLKFSTRALSGICQGGFCTHRILKILARETGLAPERITKKGPGSEIVLASLSKGASQAGREEVSNAG